MNLIDVDLDQDGAHLGARPAAAPQTMAALAADGSKTATLGFRPESVRMVGEGEGPLRGRRRRGARLRRLRLRTLHTSRSKEGDKLTTLRVDARKPPMKGETIHIQINPDEATCSRPRPDAGSPATPPPPSSPVEPPGPHRPDLRPTRRPGFRPLPADRAAPLTKQVSEGVHMRTRSSVTATAVLGAVTVLTAGCLSDEGGGGGGSSNTSNTIEVMYAFTGGQEEGFKAEVDAWARRTTSRSSTRRPATSTS